MSIAIARVFFLSALVVTTCMLPGCGGGVSGTYEGDGVVEKMAFKSGGKVEITAMGMTKEGTYEVEGTKIKVTAGGETKVLTVNDKGCIDAGGMIGTLCKGQPGGPGGSSSVADAGSAEAVKAVRDELDRHWLKVADGWISEYNGNVNFYKQPLGPEKLYRQLGGLEFGIRSRELSESDKRNGFTYIGDCRFEKTPKRIFDQGPRADLRNRWTRWEDTDNSLVVAKKNGKWIFQESFGGYLVSGTKPSPASVPGS